MWKVLHPWGANPEGCPTPRELLRFLATSRRTLRFWSGGGVRMKVTLDVEPGIVKSLRDAGLHYKGIAALADAIEAAMPTPEPAVGSVVTLGGDSRRIYARTEDPDLPWYALRREASAPAWQYWHQLVESDPVVVFDGAAL